MAKKVIRDDILNLEIVVEGNKAQQKLGNLESEARNLKQQVKDLGVEINKTKNKDSDAYKTMVANRKELNKQIEDNRQKQIAIRKEIGLHGLTYKQLGQEAKRLQLLLSNTTYGSEQWKKLDAELRRVKGRMHEVRGGAMQTGFSLSKMATGFNKYFMMVSTFALSISGLIMGIRKAYLAYAEFDDKLADVMKTTGLTKDEVKELNKELEKIDTRSSQEDLLNLSRIAGKLGINAKEDVLGFVRAADKINVALSEDLGGGAEEAIRELGKLTDIFKLKDVYGIEESLLKIGSTINALGAASTANEPYLVEFTKRLAGIAPSVDISIQNVLGLAATLDQLGQTSEVSSTVMSQLIPKMFKDTATFANIARMSLSDFSKLLKEDTNEALLRVLEGLKGNSGGFEELVHIMGDMGLEGKRSISVLGVLANNTDLIREQQGFANDEFEKGTSILNEFNVKNETARAGLDKAVKSIKTTTRELGEKLSPAIRGVVSSGTMLIRGLSTVVDFFTRYWKIIKISAVALLSYIAATKAYSIAVVAAAKAKALWSVAVQLFTGKINLAAVAMQFFNKVSKANMFGLVVSAITAVVTALVMFNRQANNAAKMQKEFNQIQKDGILEERRQVAELDKLFVALRKTTFESKERKNIIDALHSQHGITIKNYKDQKLWEQELTRAYKEGTAALKNRIAVRVYDEKLAILRAKELDYEEGLLAFYKQRLEYENKIASARAKGVEAIHIPSTWISIYDRASFKMREYNNLLQENRKQQDELAKKSVKLAVTLKDAFSTDPSGDGDGGDGDGGDGDGGDGDKTKNKLDKLKAEAEKIKDAWQKLYDELALIEMTEYQKSVELLRREMEAKKETIEKAYSTVDPVTKKRIISEQEKNDALLILDQDYVAATWLLAQKELERWQKTNDEQLQIAEDTAKKKLAIREEYDLIEQEQELKKALDKLELDRITGELSEEEYQKARSKIINKYAKITVIDRDQLEGAQAYENLQNWYDKELGLLKSHLDNKTLTEKEYQEELAALENTHAKLKKDLDYQTTMATLDAFSNMFGQLASMFEEGSVMYKAFAIFQVTIDTVKATMGAFNSMIEIPIVGPVLAPIAAAAAAAFGIAQIVKISNMEVPQHYQGYYDVLGEQTGKKYQAKYKGKPQTGYVTTPSLYLAGDDPHRLKEMIISGPDLKNPMIADYARAIMDIKANRQTMVAAPVQQSAPVTPAATGQGAIAGNAELVALLASIDRKLDKPTRAKVVYNDLEEAKQKMDRIEKDVTRN